MGYIDEKLVFHPMPDFRGDYHAANKYRERELKRSKEGFELAKGVAFDRKGHDIDYLSGIHYYFLAKQKIKPTAGRGGLLEPYYTPWDREFFNTWNWCMAHGWDMEVIKRRRWGFTVKAGGVIPTWLQVTDPGSSYCMTSCDEDRLNFLITDKLKPAVLSCVEEGYFDKDFYSDKNRMIFASVKDKTSVGGTIYFINTSRDKRSASKGAGSGNRGYTLDEKYLHPYADLVSLSLESTMRMGLTKVGTGLKGGSCDTFTKTAIDNLKDTLENVWREDSKIKILFIPGYADQWDEQLGRLLTEDEATKILLEERRKLRSAADKGGSKMMVALQNRIKEDPFTLEELVSNVESDYFSTAIIHNINKGASYAVSNTLKQVNLIEHRGIIFEDNSPVQGKILYPDEFHLPVTVVESPQSHCVYSSGLDPIDFLGAMRKGSFFWDLMKNLTTNKYVASLAFRTDDPQLGYQLWYNFHYWYRSQRFINGAPCMAEKNKLASLMALCQAHGTLNLILRDPFKRTFDSDMYSDMDRGWHKSANDIQQKTIMNYAKQYLEHDIVPWKRFNEGFPAYRMGENEEFEKNDICDAFLMSELGSNSLHRGFRTEDEEKPLKKEIIMVRDEKGFKHQRIVMR